MRTTHYYKVCRRTLSPNKPSIFTSAYWLSNDYDQMDPARFATALEQGEILVYEQRRKTFPVHGAIYAFSDLQCAETFFGEHFKYYGQDGVLFQGTGVLHEYAKPFRLWCGRKGDWITWWESRQADTGALSCQVTPDGTAMLRWFRPTKRLY